MYRRGAWTAATLVALMAACLVPGVARAQQKQPQARKLAVEGRLGVTFPTGGVGQYGGQSGLAFTADLLYRFQPQWSIYAGYGVHDMNCRDCPDDLGSSGIELGGKYLLTASGPAVPWGRAGFFLGKAAAFQGGQHVESKRSLGFELGAGIDLGISRQISLEPALSLIHYHATLPVQDLGMSYFLLGLGVHYHF